MTDRERAERWAALLTSYGDNWRANVPADATVHPNIGVIHLGGVRIVRGADGIWSVAPVTLQQAREIALDPIWHSRAHLALALDVLRRELDQAEAHAVEAQRLRDLRWAS